ncbi:hypothetical protein K3495_g9055 [Podosphaera aphanis]|nr:hypothetical protein K3495_g9055 [Podosphaera aphanis]
MNSPKSCKINAENCGNRPNGFGHSGSLSSNPRPGMVSASRENIAISRALSKILRHGAGDMELKLDREGYARVDELLKWQRLKSLRTTFADIQEVVNHNPKKRFSMKSNPTPTLAAPPDHPSQWLIRANQGHSIAGDFDGLLAPITHEADNVPETVIHGTYFAFYKMIIETGGLSRMTRNHIHFCTTLEDDKRKVQRGIRNDAELLIYVDIKASLADGILWWLSENGVVLTAGDERGFLPKKYFKRIVGRKEDIGSLWEDGVEVGQLPEHLLSRKAPMNKMSQVNRTIRKKQSKQKGQSTKDQPCKEDSSRSI